MPIIELTTIIEATIEICFDLTRSIDFHTITTEKTKEKAVAGKSSGLVELNDWVTWEATHLGFRQKLTSRITAMNEPFMFIDEQISGAFKSIHHLHTFEQKGSKVLMKDVFQFESPFGFLGKICNSLVLTRYMKNFLLERNRLIKKYAESDKYKSVISQ